MEGEVCLLEVVTGSAGNAGGEALLHYAIC